MALINRVSRLFRADLHAVLDRIEEPDVLLKQAVREMEDELGRDEQRIKVLRHEHAQIVARETDVAHSTSEIEEELDVCFESGKTDLARALIKRKLESQRFRKLLSRKRDGLQAALIGLEARLDENRARLESMRQKAELMTEDSESHPVEDNWTVPDITVRDEEVEVAFLREKQKRRAT